MSCTKYFKFEKGSRQGDPISAYLFLFLKLPLFSLKKIKILRVLIFLTIYSYILLMSRYTFFLSDEDSVIEVMNAFDKISLVCGLKPSEAKCEIAGIGVLKGVSLAICDMDCIDLTQKTKILGIHFSFNKKLETRKLYQTC